MGDELDGWKTVDKPDNRGIVVSAPGDIEIPSLGFPEDFLSVLADASNTRGLASFLEYRIAPHGKGPPAHWHTSHDELFYVVTGQLGMLAGETRDLFGP